MSVSLNTGGGGGKEVLTAARTYFVDTAGNDSNDGLTAPTAFLTIQKAIDTWQEIDNAGFTVTIQVAAGTYTIGTPISITTALGGGELIILGDAGTPTNCVLTDGGAMITLFDYTGSESGYLKIQGFYIHDGGGSTTVGLVDAANHKTIVLSDINWGDADFFSAIFTANRYCDVTVEGTNVISGSSIDTVGSARDHCSLFIDGTLDVTGSPFGSNFVDVQNHSILRASSLSLTVTNPGGGFWSLGSFINEWSYYDVTASDPLLVIGDAQTQNGSQYTTSSDGMASLGNGLATSSANLNELRFDNNVIANSVGIQADTVGGVPSSSPNNGTLVVDTANNDLYFRSTSGWVQANGGGGGGEDYFVESYTGGLPTAAGAEAIAIGGDASAGGGDAIAIGRTSNASQTHAIAIGEGAGATGLETISIGVNALANTTDAISIGTGSACTGQEAVAIGQLSRALATATVAIGDGARADTASAVAIGEDTDASATAAIAIGDRATVRDNSTNSIAIGLDSDVGDTSANSIAIGTLSTTGANDSNAIAIGTSTLATEDDSVALGQGATSSAVAAVQIGAGTNSTASTLQFLGNTLADSNGLKTTTAKATLGSNFSVADSSFTTVNWDTEAYDQENYHDNVTNNERLTVARAGTYILVGCIEWASNATGFRTLAISKNGGTLLATTRIDATSTTDFHQIVVTDVASASDFYTLGVTQTSGGNLDVVDASSTHFSITRLG